MDSEIALILAVDGVSSGAIYVLMALGIVMVFNVTRVALIPFGDLAAYAALTFCALQDGKLPGTVWLVGVLAAVAFLTEVWTSWRQKTAARLPKAVLTLLVLPLAPACATLALRGTPLPLAAQIALTFGLVLPLGPLLYRLAFRPMVNAPVLVLMMVAVAAHLVLTGLSLLFFGPEGLRARPFVTGDLAFAGVEMSAQGLLVTVAAGVLAIAATVYFTATTSGKALRATAMNRTGARLVGIRTTSAGSLAFLLATGIATVSGILLAPITTVYYDTGFLIGLKGFVGAVVGGFVAYPPAVVGALLIGQIESFAAFQASSYKEMIVFGAIIPIVTWRWLTSGGSHDDESDEEEVSA